LGKDMRLAKWKCWLSAVISCVLTVSLAATLASAQQPLSKGKGAENKTRKRLATIPSQAHLGFARRSSNLFRDPIEWAFRPVNELRLTIGTFTSRHAPDVAAPETFELLCYNGQPVGPTIRVRRGATFRIRLKNDLPKGAVNRSPGSGSGFPPNPKAERPVDLCITNLHTHGLHVSPNDPADNIFREIEPGEEQTFEYRLPKDHPSGTFWYHPHKHGSVAYQLSNGVAGALIVEGMPNDGINDLEDIPEIRAAKERILLFQLYNYRVGVDNVARIDATTIYNVQPDAVSSAAIQVTDRDPAHPKIGQATAINGVINPTITIAPGEVQRWRLIHAAWDMDRLLTLVDDDDHPASDLLFREIALDGLATGTMAEKSVLEIAPGQRSDVLIQAPQLPPGVRNRVYHLKQSDIPGDQAPHGLAQDPLYLAKVVVVGRPQLMKLPNPQAIAKCRPFVDIRNEELTQRSSFPNGLVFAAYDGDSHNPPYYTINGTAFHNQQNVQIRLGTAEEWTLKAGVSSHPFHIHVNAFQVVTYIDPQGKTTPMNVWRDTLYIKEHETYKIRSRFRDFVGKTVFHCHILDHEDQGMAMPIEFIPNNRTPSPTKAVPNATLKRQLSTPVPAVKLWDTSGALRDLVEFRRRNVVLVFFRGMHCPHCPHCTDQLRDLVRQTRDAQGFDAVIVAVSSEPIPDTQSAFKILNVSASDRFYLFVDEGHSAFRAFGCFKNDDPQHGLFLIDRNGDIRAGYVGASPYDDANEVIRQVGELGGNHNRAAAR
jgi:FtsP/CotA-like multicopper oxidase with cupredoxin domain/peroxiredoxin